MERRAGTCKKLEKGKRHRHLWFQQVPSGWSGHPPGIRPRGGAPIGVAIFPRSKHILIFVVVILLNINLNLSREKTGLMLVRDSFSSKHRATGSRRLDQRKTKYSKKRERGGAGADLASRRSSATATQIKREGKETDE